MSQRLQSWLLTNTKSLQFIVNERLAQREGAVGTFFKFFELGKRQMSSHSWGKWVKFVNWWYIRGAQVVAARRLPISRLLNVTTGPLNYSGMFVYFWATIFLFNRFRFIRQRDVLRFNQ